MKNAKHPESLMMSFGYLPELSEGSVKPPVFMTSTFAFKTAEEGKAFFELAYGLREQEEGESQGLIYSRINNPNLEILEDRLCLWNGEEECAVFESGMSAISTVFLEFLKPGDLLLYSLPLYGGTEHFINHFLTGIGVHCIGFYHDESKEQIIKRVEEKGGMEKLKLIYLETPANPTNDLIDIQMAREIANYFSTPEKQAYLVADNTYMGPLWSNPMRWGADLVLYSATKYIGGHSDLIAGAVLGKHELMQRVKVLRTFLGNMPSPHTCWLLMRSLETLQIRMEKQAANAVQLAHFLKGHPEIEHLHYLGFITKGSRDYDIFKRQYRSGGAMLSFEIKGGEPAAFRFLNHLKIIKLAVSLGSTESLVQHPATMTHVALPDEMKKRIGISDGLIRLSVGVEHFEDLIDDIKHALDAVNVKTPEPAMG